MQCFRSPRYDPQSSSAAHQASRTSSREVIPMQPALCVRGVSKVYRSGARGRALATPALREIRLDVDRGEIVGLVGRPGAGKSSLLLCLAGLLRADEGTITWFGEQITPHHVPPG